MSFEEFSKQKESQVELSERDKEIAENLQQKLEELEGFEPSGNINEDFNKILEITGRDELYKKVDESVDPGIVLAGLSGIKTAWEKILRDPEKVDFSNLAKKLFYVDVPNKEIEIVNKTINYYLGKMSNKDKVESDADFENFKPEKKE